MDPKTTHVRDLVHSDVVWCFDDQNVSEGAKLMQDHQIRRLMIINHNDKQLVGIVSLGDLATNGNQKVSTRVLESVSEPAEV